MKALMFRYACVFYILAQPLPCSLSPLALGNQVSETCTVYLCLSFATLYFGARGSQRFDTKFAH